MKCIFKILLTNESKLVIWPYVQYIVFPSVIMSARICIIAIVCMLEYRHIGERFPYVTLLAYVYSCSLYVWGHVFLSHTYNHPHTPSPSHLHPHIFTRTLSPSSAHRHPHTFTRTPSHALLYLSSPHLPGTGVLCLLQEEHNGVCSALLPCQSMLSVVGSRYNNKYFHVLQSRNSASMLTVGYIYKCTQADTCICTHMYTNIYKLYTHIYQ